MTIQELLKQNGLTDEQIEAVTSAMKENKIYTAGEENLDTRYNKLKGDHDGTLSELSEANKLIDELKKTNQNDEGLQQKVYDYENTVAELQTKLEKTKLESAIKVELLGAKAQDVDYMTYKLKEKGELKLGSDGKIEGWKDKINALKTQFPNQFESGSGKKIDEHKLEQGEQGETVSKEAFDKMGYQERLKLFNENPKAFEEFTKEG